MALVVPAMIITRFALTAGHAVIAALVIAAFTMATMIITRLTLTASQAVIATFVIAAFAMAAMIITWLTLTASQAVIAALVIAAFTMATMIIARLAFTPSHAAVMATTVITPMTAFALALTTHGGGLLREPIVATMTPFPLAVATTVITGKFLRPGRLSRGLTANSALADCPRGIHASHRMTAEALMHGPVNHAPTAAGNVAGGRTATMSLAVAAGEQRESGSDDCHCRTND